MSTENETKFARGFFFKRPKEGAPSFVKGNLGIKIDEAIEFLKEQRPKGEFCNLDLLLSKSGDKLYLKLNDFQPKPKEGGYGDDAI